jgi:hypothetical protein
MPASCTIRRTSPAALSAADFSRAAPVRLEHIRPESSAHRPQTRCELLHDSRALYLRFTVCDRYVRVVHTCFNAPVCQDSCVEFFVQPRAHGGYFNFEFNAGGALLAGYIEDPVRTPSGFKKATPLESGLCRRIEVIPSLPRRVDPEITQPLTWTLAVKIPLAVMEQFTGSLACTPGTLWRGNFYKCADRTSHPHWLSWSPVRELNFHDPECFGELRF